MPLSIPIRCVPPFSQRNLLAFGIALLASIALAETEPPPQEEPPSPLSHAALFAPNTTFPYFENGAPLASSPSFSLANAATLAQFSMLVYVKDSDFIRETLRQAGFSQVEIFDTDGTFAIVALRDDDCVVAFRGTETADKTDYYTDAKIGLRPFGDRGKAHRGFIEALQRVDPDLQQSLDRALKPADSEKRRLWITGHSLGAALGTLLAIRNEARLEGLYTIGSPRVGNRKLVLSVPEAFPAFRLVNDNDIIARMPPPASYRHIGLTYFITADGELHESPEFFESFEYRARGHRQFIKRLWQEHWLKGDFDAIPSDYFVDHSPRLYVEALLAASEQDEPSTPPSQNAE